MSYFWWILTCLVIGIAKYFLSVGIKVNNNKRLDDKIVIITGGNSGIGRETALDLANRGAHVIIASRNKELSQKVAKDIIKKTNNSKVDVEELSLDNFQSIRDFAQRIKERFSHLDILVNNAGIMGCPYSLTKDGFEMHFAVNYLGPFLLTNLLLDLLKKSSSSRIINVSSVVHKYGKINWDDFNLKKNFNSFKAYCQSKLANILFTIELSKRLEDNNVSSVSLHPGIVRTEILRYTDKSIGFLVPYFLMIVYPIYWLISKSSKEGAQTTIYCCVDDSIPYFSGKYFSDCKVKELSKEAQRSRDANVLWNDSLKLVGLSKESRL